MKKVILVVIFFISLTGFSQQSQEKNTEKRNEVKTNMFNLIAFKWLDLGYERLINEEASLGLGLLFTIDNGGNSGLDEYRTFSLTPYYRHFFSKKYAQGFFVEGFGMLHSGKNDVFVVENNVGGSGHYKNKPYTNFAVGISAGAKFVTNRGFIAEIYLGIGRDLVKNRVDNIEIVGRGGISLGFRF